MPGATSSFLLLVARPGAPSSILAPSSGALVTVQPQVLVERIANPSHLMEAERPTRDGPADDEAPVGATLNQRHGSDGMRPKGPCCLEY